MLNLSHPLTMPWGDDGLCNTQELLCVDVRTYVIAGMCVCVCVSSVKFSPRHVAVGFGLRGARSAADHLQQPDDGASWRRRAGHIHVPGTDVWPLLQRPPHPQDGR